MCLSQLSRLKKPQIQQKTITDGLKADWSNTPAVPLWVCVEIDTYDLYPCDTKGTETGCYFLFFLHIKRQ